METKLNIIEQIEILRNNQKKYSHDEYQKTLTCLYTKLSKSIEKITLNEKKITPEDKDVLFGQILNCKTFNELLGLPSLHKLSYVFPLFDMYLMENNIIQFKKITHPTQLIPIIKKCDKVDVVEKVKLLLHICDISNIKYNKAIVFIVMYNEIFINYKFLIKYVNFAKTVKNKINDVYNDDNDLNAINSIIKKYNLNKNTFIEWKKKINEDVL